MVFFLQNTTINKKKNSYRTHEARVMKLIIANRFNIQILKRHQMLLKRNDIVSF